MTSLTPPSGMFSFGINSARAYWNDLVLPSFSDFDRNRESVRLAISCAIFLRHVVDWLIAEMGGPAKLNECMVSHPSRLAGHYTAYLASVVPGAKSTTTNFSYFLYYSKSPDVTNHRISRAIADGSKHFILTKNVPEPEDVYSTRVARGFMVPMQIPLKTTNTLVVVDDKKQEWRALGVLKSCIDDWQEFFDLTP